MLEKKLKLGFQVIQTYRQKQALEKRALTYEDPSLLGRFANYLAYLNPVVWGKAMSFDKGYMKVPHRDEDEKRHRRVTDILENEEPELYKDTVVRLGGSDTLSDLWRVINNDKTTLLGKAYGLMATPFINLVSNLNRSPRYNPWADVINQPADVPHFTVNELMEAGLVNKNVKDKDSLADRMSHDIVGGTSSLLEEITDPFYAIQTDEKLKEILEKSKDEKLKTEIHNERRVLTPTLVGAHAGGLLGEMLGPESELAALGSLGGTLVGAGYGSLQEKKKLPEEKKEEKKTTKTSQDFTYLKYLLTIAKKRRGY
jgi:hypothetical protein